MNAQGSGNNKLALPERFERTVGNDNCVSFENMKLQIPTDRYHCHYVKANVTVLRRMDGTLAILHGSRELAEYDTTTGKALASTLKAVA